MRYKRSFINQLARRRQNADFIFASGTEKDDFAVQDNDRDFMQGVGQGLAMAAKDRGLDYRTAIAGNDANRMIEQLQLLKPSDVTASTLSQLNLIDSGQTAAPYTFTSIPLDHASQYSPRQALPNGTGTLDVIALPNSSVEVRVRIGWTSSSRRARTLQSGLILGGFR